MKNPLPAIRTIALLLAAALLVPAVNSQDTKQTQPSSSSSSASAASASVPGDKASNNSLKLQIVISEYNGTQKVSSLPYTVYGVTGSNTSLRFDTKVPIVTGTFNSGGTPANTQFTYQDIGTDIDCHVFPHSDMGADPYHVSITIQRSAVLPSNGNTPEQADARATGEPLIRSFRDAFEVMIRDGQTIEGSSSVDPATGNVVKIELTLNVQK
jgi:hypothetical protein